MRVARLHLQAAALAVALTGASSMVATHPLAAQDPANQGVIRSASQLEQLVGPIALYADPLLAQVLLATTFPDQVREAAAHVRGNGTADIDNQPWDVSVKAIAHYPSVLNMLDSKPDWMNDLGQAYASQSADVMAAVQRLRQSAVAKGNLVTTPQQQVVTESNQVAIWPANPRIIYVPVYDPDVVYVRYAGYYGPRPFISFGFGYPIGPWFIYDTDWIGARVVYTGWVGGGWIARSRPYVVMSPVYVHDRYRVPAYGRGWGRGEVGYRPSPRTYWDGGRYRNEPRGEARGYGDRGEARGYGDRGEARGYGDHGEARGYGDRGEARGYGDRGEIRGGARTAVPRGESRGESRAGDVGRGQGGAAPRGDAGRGQGNGDAGRGQGNGGGRPGGQIASGPNAGRGGGWSRGGWEGHSGGSGGNRGGEGHGGGGGGNRGGEGHGGGRGGGHRG